MADPITPGVPRRFAPVTEIQRVPRTEPPSKPPPKQATIEPTVIVQGHQWRVTVPIALLVAAASLFAGRQTAPSPDANDLAVMKTEIRADIAELRRSQEANAKYAADRIDGVSNRLVIIEAKLGARP